VASINRTAYPRFKRVVLGRELAEAFSLTANELAWVRSRTQTGQHQLALAVWLKSYQRLGYFPKLEDVPPVIVDHVRGGLGLGEEVLAAHESPRTAKWHRQVVREFIGVVYEPAKVRVVAESAIRKAVQTKDNPADLVNVALEELVRQRCELPGFTTLDVLVATIRAEVNTALFTQVAVRIGNAGRARLARLLLVDPVTRRSEFDRLKDPAKAATLGKFKTRLAYLQALDALGPTESWLDGVPPGKIAHFAGEAKVTDVADLRKVGKDKRLTLMACLLHTTRTAARDEVVTMFCKRMATIHKKGREHLEQLHEQHRAESERLIGVLGDVLAAARDAIAPSASDVDGPGEATVIEAVVGDTPGPDADGGVAERVGRLVFKALDDAGGIEDLAAAHEAVSAYHGNNYLPLLDRYYRSHRPALFTLLDVIELEPTSADHSVADAVEFLRAHRNTRSTHIPDTLTVDRTGPDGQPQEVVLAVDVEAFASTGWRKILRDKAHPGLLVRRYLEVCVFSYLATELRSGDIAVVGSDSFANLHEQLMDWEECAPLVPAFCAQAGIPTDAAALTEHYRRKLTAVAAAVDTGYPGNTDLVLENGRPMLRRRKGAERRSSALALEQAIHDRLPQRALLDILTRTAYLLGWHTHFGPASGSDPKIRDVMTRYVLTAFAHGTLLGPAQVAAHMRGQVSVHELTLAGNKHTTAAKIDKACTVVINAFNQLDVAAVWGDGKVVAADGSQVDTWEDNLLAETSIRYGGYGGYGGIAYRHISNTYIALFSHFIPCGCGKPSTSSRGCSTTTPRSSRTPCTPTPRASRCRCSGSRRCWGSTCCRASATGRIWCSTDRTSALGTSTSTRCSVTRRSTGA
jgi:hypothetical protein